MPNQRKKTKRGISVYVPEEIKDALRAECMRRGVTLARLVTEIYRSELRKLGYTIKAKEGANDE